MKVNELRVGNYVMHPDNKSYFGVSGALIKELQISQHLQKDLKPIPLTEEWLEKFGFEKIKHIHNGIYYLHRLVKISIYPNGMIELRGSVGWNKMQYVHQLQNLYFALTGEELEIKI